MSIRDIMAKVKLAPDEKETEKKGEEYRDTRSPVKLGIWILLIGFGSFLLWAAFAPLDEGVPCQGLVSIATKRKVVENLRGGRVEKVNVREGQMVKEGDVLIMLDSQTARARYDEVHQHYLGMRATADRLIAEMRGAPSISFHKDLLTEPDRQLAQQNMQNQRQLFLSRRVSLQILNKQLEAMTSLAREGYAPLNQQHELELKIAEFKSSTASQLAQVQLEVEADGEKNQSAC